MTCSFARSLRSCTSAAVIAGKADARPLTAPIAPRAIPSRTNGSLPMNTSSPSSDRYGSTAANGVSDTFMPRTFAQRSRIRPITSIGIGYPLRPANS